MPTRSMPSPRNTALWETSRAAGRTGPQSTPWTRNWTPSVNILTTNTLCPSASKRARRVTDAPRRVPKQQREPNVPSNTSTVRSPTCVTWSGLWLTQTQTERPAYRSDSCSTDMSGSLIRWWGFWWEPENMGWWHSRGRCCGKARMMEWSLLCWCDVNPRVKDVLVILLQLLSWILWNNLRHYQAWLRGGFKIQFDLDLLGGHWQNNIKGIQRLQSSSDELVWIIQGIYCCYFCRYLKTLSVLCDIWVEAVMHVLRNLPSL